MGLAFYDHWTGEEQPPTWGLNDFQKDLDQHT